MRRVWKIVMLVGLACIVALVATPVASAGDYTIELNWTTAPGVCSLGGFVGADLPYFSGACAGLGPQGNSAPSISSEQGSTVPAGYYNGYWSTTAPFGLSIASVEASYQAYNLTGGWTAGSFWDNGAAGLPWTSAASQAETESDDNINSPDWAFQLVCPNGGCRGSTQAEVQLESVDLTVSETNGPALAAPGSTNLWNQSGWVWNAPGQHWNLEATGRDPSGVCSINLTVAGQSNISSSPQDPYVYQQCAAELDADPQVDTSQYEPSSGSLQLGLTETDAAGNQDGATQTVKVDNVAPTIAINQLNDNASTGAGNNADAELQIVPTTGPSGVSSVSCTVDGQPVSLSGPDAQGDYGLAVDDSESNTVACSVANNAVNPQGQHNTASATDVVKAFDSSAVSFQRLLDPLIRHRVRERVRVGYHYVTRHRRNGKTYRVKVGGHVITRTVVKSTERCTFRKVKVRGKSKLKKVCVGPSTRYQQSLLLRHGRTTTIYGQLLNAAGQPLAGQPVTIVSSPINGSASPTTIGVATTNATGGWTAKVPAGPSRTITAQYAGSSTQLPSSASATVSVPAKIRLSISPRRLPWGAPMTLSGRLLGGNVPADGVAMRLLIKIPGLAKPYAGPSFRTTATGTFRLRYVAPRIYSTPRKLPIAVDLVGTEDNYPFLPNHSPYVDVLLGERTPPTSHHRRRHPKHRAGQR